MKHTHIPKIFFGIVTIFALLLVLGDQQTALGQTSSTAPTSQQYLTGFAWSSNIGWISARGTNYGIELSPTGALSGYAWASNLGWISFNAADVASCPSGACAPTVNQQTGAVDGWARACSGTRSKDCKGADRTDGWEGWIHLSGNNHSSPNIGGTGGVTYLPSTGNLKGYAWGGEVVGWINFNGVSVVNNKPIVDLEEYGDDDVTPPVISLFRMNPNTANKGQSCTMVWEVENADDCTITGAGYTAEYDVDLPSGTDKTAAIQSSQIYNLTCSNSAGSVSKTAACRLNPQTQED